MSHNQNRLSNTKLYRVYRSMINRCYKEYDEFFNDYGGRGIKICDEWLGNNGFLRFYNWSLENGYSEGLSIERKDVNGNYCPENCCWITMAEQQWRVIDMTHIETLVMNEIRKALENLERQGVGYIDCEQIVVIHYKIDGRNIRVQVSDTTLSV